MQPDATGVEAARLGHSGIEAKLSGLERAGIGAEVFTLERTGADTAEALLERAVAGACALGHVGTDEVAVV